MLPLPVMPPYPTHPLSQIQLSPAGSLRTVGSTRFIRFSAERSPQRRTMDTFLPMTSHADPTEATGTASPARSHFESPTPIKRRAASDSPPGSGSTFGSLGSFTSLMCGAWYESLTSPSTPASRIGALQVVKPIPGANQSQERLVTRSQAS